MAGNNEQAGTVTVVFKKPVRMFTIVAGTGEGEGPSSDEEGDSRELVVFGQNRRRNALAITRGPGPSKRPRSRFLELLPPPVLEVNPATDNEAPAAGPSHALTGVSLAVLEDSREPPRLKAEAPTDSTQPIVDDVIVGPAGPGPSTSENCSGTAPIPTGSTNAGGSKKDHERGQKSQDAEDNDEQDSEDDDEDSEDDDQDSEDDDSEREEEERNVQVTHHRRGRSYVCDLCKETLPTRYDWNIHREMHLGFRPFLCPLCPKAYETELKVLEHCSQYHRMEPMFTCEECGKEYTLERFLKNHQETMHGDSLD